ncbi:MAG: 2TM domain-containing protein [Candidatus Cloacimonetes bacterium]|nr:2TM domain-containing protein [Candidatus Cloacimonadota bacterium]
MDENELRREARKHVNELKGFYIHLATFVIVNLGLFALCYIQGQNWWIWTVFGWSIGLLVHAISLFGPRFFFTRKWEEDKIRKYMDDNR